MTVYKHTLLLCLHFCPFSEMTETYLHNTITEVLPDLPSVKGHSRKNVTIPWGGDDFLFLEEADLLSALRPIQARKVIAAWKLKCK